TGAFANRVTLAGIRAPSWLKLVRDGNLIDGYVSATGAYGTWVLVGTATVPMAATVNFGLVVSATNNCQLSTATFSSVAIAPIIPMGANLADVRDFSLTNAFVDMIKQARQFTSIVRSTLGNYVPATVDANGWPTEDFEAIIQTGALNTAKVYNGTYKLSFTGRATVSTSVTPGGELSDVSHNAATTTTTATVGVNARNDCAS